MWIFALCLANSSVVPRDNQGENHCGKQVVRNIWHQKVDSLSLSALSDAARECSSDHRRARQNQDRAAACKFEPVSGVIGNTGVKVPRRLTPRARGPSGCLK